MTDKPRLMWHSNSPMSGTGYGQQTALFLPKLAEHYQPTISAFWGVEGAVIPWNGIPVLPGIGSTYGNECIKEHALFSWGGDVRKGLTVTLMDVWVLDPHIWSDLNTVSWVPVDHDPCPRQVAGFFHDSGAVPVAMSQFGVEKLRNENLDPLYCPHGVDTDVLKPMDQAEAREATGMQQDAYVVGMFAANKGNPSRKNFVEAFQAFKAFHAKHPDSLLYLHTEITGRFQGVNLRALMDAVGIPREACIIPDQYRMTHFPYDGDVMRALYNSIDVLLAPSAGEGFGIPVIEAQACGKPVIASDFTAQPELVGAGWLVEGTKYFTPIGSWQFRPDVGDIIHALEQAYQTHGNPAYAEQARERALEYDADRVFQRYMLPALAEAQQRFDERQPVELAAAA